MNIDLNSTVVYSENFTKSRTKIKAYLRDIYPNEEVRTINILLNVYESGIAKELAVDKKIVQKCYIQYVKRLRYDYGMDLESATEALNAWIDTCVGEGRGAQYGDRLIKEQKQNVESKNNAPTNRGSNPIRELDVIYEDTTVKVSFYKWKRTRYSNTGWTKVVTFMFENKSDKEMGFRFQDVTVGGLVVQTQTLSYCLKAKQKGMNEFNMVYEEKLPSEMQKENHLEFVLYYDEPISGTTTLSSYSKTGYTSDVIDICLQ